MTFFLACIALQLTLLARANSCTWDEANPRLRGLLPTPGLPLDASHHAAEAPSELPEALILAQTIAPK